MAQLPFVSTKKSACHSEVVVTLSATTKNVGELLSRQYAVQKMNNRQALYQIMRCIRFLSRQGLALRGNKDESDGNLCQLLFNKAEDNTNLAEWLKWKENVYTSPDIQNEVIKLFGLQILRDIASNLQRSPFLTIMADETTDKSNQEQVTLFLIWVTDDLQVHEEFLGLYHVNSIDAATLTSVIQDTFVRMNVSLERLHGQCYDGASSMSGSRSGVAKRISELEPRAVFTHCYGHALNLAACDTIKSIKVMRDALETTHEATKLIKYSPRRESIFQQTKSLSGCSSPGIRVLCPTRWTVRAEALASIINNFDTLQRMWEEAVEVVRDTETKARICGVSAVMNTFNFLFGCMLGEVILKHSDNLSSMLQHKSLSAAEGQYIAQMTIETLKSVRSDDSFDLFWQKVSTKTSELDIGDRELPRRRRLPRILDDGLSAGNFHDDPKSFYKQQYYEALDLIVNCIDDRFNQPGYRIYHSLESLLSKACKQEDLVSDLDIVCDFYGDDFDKELLTTQLQTLGVHYQQVWGQTGEDTSSNLSIFYIKTCLLSLSPGQLSLLSQVKRLAQLILVMPATNASSERSFSALRRAKNYLRTTVTQRLNYLMLLHVHKDKTNALDLEVLLNEFVECSEHRSNIFAKF